MASKSSSKSSSKTTTKAPVVSTPKATPKAPLPVIAPMTSLKVGTSTAGTTSAVSPSSTKTTSSSSGSNSANANVSSSSSSQPSYTKDGKVYTYSPSSGTFVASNPLPVIAPSSVLKTTTSTPGTSSPVAPSMSSNISGGNSSGSSSTNSTYSNTPSANANVPGSTSSQTISNPLPVNTGNLGMLSFPSGTPNAGSTAIAPTSSYNQQTGQSTSTQGQTGNTNMQQQSMALANMLAARTGLPATLPGYKAPTTPSTMQQQSSAIGSLLDTAAQTPAPTVPTLPTPPTPTPTPAPTPAPIVETPSAPTPPQIQDQQMTIADLAKKMQEILGADIPDSGLASAAEEEAAAQKKLQDYQNSLLLGKQQISDQVIPMEFITGQQRSLEQRGELGEMPLQQGLANSRLSKANALARQQAAMDSNKNKLAGLGAIANVLNSGKIDPVSVGKDSTLIDPATGKVIYNNNTGEATTDKPNQTDTGEKFTAAQQKQFDDINTVSGQLKNYRDLVDRYTGMGGFQLTGKQASELRAAKSNLEFSIAAAVGTGALQAADRDVVRDMIPDPTSISGAIGGAFRGGKQGNLAAIDQAQKIFDARRNTLTSQSSQIPGQPKTSGNNNGTLTWDNI